MLFSISFMILPIILFKENHISVLHIQWTPQILKPFFDLVQEFTKTEKKYIVVYYFNI